MRQEVPEFLTLVSEAVVNTIKPLNQSAGRVALDRLVKGESTPSEVLPVYVTDLRKRKHNPSVTLYIGKLIREMTFDSLVAEAFETKGAILLIPKEDLNFGYQWIDVYLVEDGKVDLDRKLSSQRINSQNRSIESRGWYGPERQAFLDYLNGKLSIADPNTLPPFEASWVDGDIPIGRIGKDYLKVHLKQNETDSLTLHPKFDPRFGYLWIEGFPKDKKSPNSDPLVTRRIISGENGVKIAEWKGVGIQSIIDWANGSIETSLMKPVEVFLDPLVNSSVVHFYSNLGIQINSTHLDKDLPLYLIPKEYGPYKWVEVKQYSKKDPHTLKTIAIDRLQMINNMPTFVARWQGADKQALVDYINGKEEFSLLRPFSIKLGKGKVGIIGQLEGKKELKLALRSSGFNEGDIIILKPTLSDKGELILEISKTENPALVLAKSTLNHDLKVFRTVSLPSALRSSRKPLGYWTADRIKEAVIKIIETRGDTGLELLSKEMPSFYALVSAKYPGGWRDLKRDLGLIQVDASGFYIDPEGVVWASITRAAEEIKMDPPTLSKLLRKHELSTIHGRGMNGQDSSLYSLDEVNSFIQRWREGGKMGVKNGEDLTSKDANTDLVGLLD